METAEKKNCKNCFWLQVGVINGAYEYYCMHRSKHLDWFETKHNPHEERDTEIFLSYVCKKWENK